MSRRKLSAVCLSLAFFGASALKPCLARVSPAQAGNSARVFQTARPINADATRPPAAFEFELRGFAYHIKANGNGRRTKGPKTRGFNLRLASGDSIAQLFYTEFEGDLLLLLHLNDAGGGAGFVTRLEQPSMRGLWRQRIAAREIGEPLREGRNLYVTGSGLIGKLDLRAGVYEWRHEGLEDVRGDEPKPLNAFDPPELRGDAVLFRERPVYNPRRTFVVNKKTGQIMKVE